MTQRASTTLEVSLIIEIEFEDERGRYFAMTVRPAEIEGDEDEDEDGEEVTLDPHLQEHLILGPDPVATPTKISSAISPTS